MVIKRLDLSSLVAIAAFMLGSANETRKISHVYRLCDATVPNTMTFTSNVLSIIIRSVNDGSGWYPPDLNCSFHLYSGDEARVLTFEFKKFKLEYSSSCNYDFLCVNGVKYCDSWAKGKKFRHIVPIHHWSTIIFRTDLNGEYSGFEIIVSARKALKKENVWEPVGIGSHEKNLSYVKVTYNSLMRYEDKCLKLSGRSTITEPSITTNEPQTKATEPPLELPLNITVRPTSATKEPFECNCKCKCTPSSK